MSILQEDCCKNFFYYKGEEIIKNPTIADFKAKVRECKIIKGFKYDNDVYIWDAYKIVHYDVQQFLQLSNPQKHKKIFKYYKRPFHSYFDFVVEGNIITFDSLGDYDLFNPIEPIFLLKEKIEVIKNVQQLAEEVSQKYNLIISEDNLNLFKLYKSINFTS